MIGALIIDKPKGLTSHDVVGRIRRAAGTRRVGHAGTLDPFATGVLVCCIGRATRLVQFLVGLDKEYIATVRLGYATDTQDGTGQQITPLRSSNELSFEGLCSVLDQFIGPQLQTPPMFSAKKIGGERLYKAARAGREIVREPSSIVVHSLKLIGDDEAMLNVNADGTCEFRVQVRCSSGTYVRTLAHDLGERLGPGGHLIDLRRTEVGHFSIADALTLEEVEGMAADELNNALISTSEMLSQLPVVILDDQRKKVVVNGRGFALSESEASVGRGSCVRLCDLEGRLVAVGKSDLSNFLKPYVVIGVEDV